jgi:acylphosphatase
VNPLIAAAEILVEGRVQGVGYRAFAERRAGRLGLAGYVTNLPDGRVLVHAEGDETVIKSFLDDLAEGPRGAHVDRTHVKWVTPTREFTSFVIRSARYE